MKYFTDLSFVDEKYSINYLWDNSHFNTSNKPLDTIYWFCGMNHSNKPNSSKSQIFIELKIWLISHFIIDSVVRSRKQENISYLIMTSVGKAILYNVVIEHQISWWLNCFDDMIIFMVDINKCSSKGWFSTTRSSRNQDTLRFISQKIK